MMRCLTIGVLMLTSLMSACVSFHPEPLPNEPEDATFVETEQARTRFIDVGEGPPVVLLHGFASSLNVWDTVVPALAENHRVLALDLKGFGWSNRPEGDYSPAAQARLVWEFLEERGVDQTAVVAHSWGASVALQMALEQPERIERIALYDAWVYAEQLPSTFIWARAGGIGEMLFGLFYKERPADKTALAFYDDSYVTYEFVEEIKSQMARPGTTAAALEAVRGQRYEDVQHTYSAVDVPVLLLWGREDKVTTLDMGERLVRQLPDAELVVYPRCGHFPMIEAVHASNQDLVDFLTVDHGESGEVER